MKYIIVIFASLFIISCNSNRIFEEYNKDFPDYHWSKSQKIAFSPNITDTLSAHKISILLRHVLGFQLEKIDMKLTMVSPSGKTDITTISMKIFDEYDEYISDCTQDICDLEFPIKENMIFKEIGTYKYTIEYDMPIDPIPNVMEIGLIIEKQAN